MQCLRRILRIQFTDRVPNTEVLRKANIDGIECSLMRNQLRWAGHVKRMDDNRIPKQLLFGQLKIGVRSRGRPKFRYSDSLQVSLKNCNLGFRSWEILANSRTAWRSAVYEGVKSYEAHRISSLEQRREARKRTNPFLRILPGGLICPTCGKSCLSRIGLAGHCRSHAGPPAKRQRVS